MSYYDAQSPASWQHPRPSWDARPGTTPDHQPFHPMHRAQTSDTTDLTTRFTAQLGKPEDPAAFGSQIDEVDRAVDNLVKSGKMFPQARRDSMPMLGPRGFPVEPHGIVVIR
jgi:ABC-type phosphate transport system substrate-binding protein